MVIHTKKRIRNYIVKNNKVTGYGWYVINKKRKFKV